MEDFVRFANSKGVKKYGFSSHAPLPFHTKWTMNEDDFPDYERGFIALKPNISQKQNCIWDWKWIIFMGVRI